MLHEQRTGVYYFSTVTKLLHFTAFTLLCLACVKAYYSKDVRSNSISKNLHHTIFEIRMIKSISVWSHLFSIMAGTNRFSGFAELDLSFLSL